MKTNPEMLKKAVDSAGLTVERGRALVFIITCFLSLLHACKSGGDKRSNVVVLRENGNSKTDSFSTIFGRLLESSIKPDSNYALLLDSFIRKPVPNAIDYGFFLRFLMINNDESLNEQAAFQVFENLKRNKPKRERLEFYIQQLPPSKQSEVRSKLVQFLCIELSAEGYDSERSVSAFYGFKDSVSLTAVRECLGGLAQ